MVFIVGRSVLTANIEGREKVEFFKQERSGVPESEEIFFEELIELLEKRTREWIIVIDNE